MTSLLVQVHYAEVRTAWAEEPQLELIAGTLILGSTKIYFASGLSVNWTRPSLASLGGFSSTCWLLGRELYRARWAAPPHPLQSWPGRSLWG